MSSRWSQEELTLALQMLERGDDGAAFLKTFGRTKKAAEHRRDRVRNGCPAPKSNNGPRARSMCLTNGTRVIVSDSALKDATRRAVAPRSLTAAIFGDPPEGYSALDRRRSA